MAEKHIFIGLGGAGVNTVTKVKYKIYEKLTATKHKSRLDLLEEKYRFLFIDTDKNDIESCNEEYRDRFEYGKTDFINPVKELIDLGDQNPRVIYDEAKSRDKVRMNKRILEACTDAVSGKMPNKTLRHGAGAFRMQSRIAFARMSEEFSSKLRMCLVDLNSIEEGATERNTIYYWVVTSSNGGTGSGILNDVLYYVNMMHKQLVDAEDPMVGLLLYMPQFYIDMNATNERYPKNAYATLSELDTFQRLARIPEASRLFHRLALHRDYHQFNTNTAYRPFRYCIPVDFQTDKGTNMGNINNMYFNTAEMLYYIHSGPGADGFRSILDNYVDEIQATAPEAFLIPMGYIALRKPEKDFEDYMQLRMRYELLQYGMIGRQISSPEECKAITVALYNNHIHKILFDGGNDRSFYTALKNIVHTKLEDELPDNLIKDSNNKILKRLPVNVSNAEADRVVEEATRAIRRKTEQKKTATEQIETELWRWLEDNIRKQGLEYTKTVLFELDGYCTELYNTFQIDSKGGISARKAKQQHIDSIAAELDNLYAKAMEITVGERISGKNSEDVFQYFQQLREYVSAKLDMVVADELYDILRTLCIGDNGTIDQMKRYVANLLSEAHHMLSGERGAEFAYSELAKTFLEKSRDVTSVYLPDIQDFAEGYGWKENHLFSQWYAGIIEHTDQYERGKGFVPARSGSEKSIEGFFLSMAAGNQEQMIEKGYLKKDELRLFTNFSITNPKKILEDILYFAATTMDRLCHENTLINNMWYSKTLPRFYDELDQEKRREVKKRLDPCLFFTYNQAKENKVMAMRRIYVASSTKIAEEVLQYNNGDNNAKFAASSDPSMIYTIKARMGLSIDFYRTLEVIKREYDNAPDKELYHFHSAFAFSNGDYHRIVLEKELDRELITFVQYLLMDGYRDVLAEYYHASSDPFDKDNFSNSPFELEDKRALVATKRNISHKGERICLSKSDGSRELFSSLLFGSAEAPFVTIYSKFRDIYTNDNLEQAIGNLIAVMNRMATVQMQTNYDDVRKALIEKFNARWTSTASREEKSVLGDILTSLKTELDSFEKFLI